MGEHRQGLIATSWETDLWYHNNTSMGSILIRNVPPDILRTLKRLALIHHRSLQGELHAILERAASMAPPEAGVSHLDLVTVKVGSTASWNREQIYGSDGR